MRPYGCAGAGGSTLESAGTVVGVKSGASAVGQGGLLSGLSGLIPVVQGVGAAVSLGGAEGGGGNIGDASSGGGLIGCGRTGAVAGVVPVVGPPTSPRAPDPLC